MVVEVGFTVNEPTSVLVLKLPGVMATDEAFVTLKESVLVPAEATREEEAEKEVIEGKAPEAVVPVAMEDEADILPTLSCASTYQKYVVDVARSASAYVVSVVVAMSGIVEVLVPRWMA